MIRHLQVAKRARTPGEEIAQAQIYLVNLNSQSLDAALQRAMTESLRLDALSPGFEPNMV